VGADPWRIYMNHDGKCAITPNNGDQTISIIDLRRTRWRPPSEAGENDRREFRCRQGVRHQLDQRVRLRLRYEDVETSQPDQDRVQHSAETATTDTADESSIWRTRPKCGRHHRCKTEAVRENLQRQALSMGRTSWTARTTTATERLPYPAPTTELAVVGAGFATPRR
jgi:hypothetical protein